MHETSIIIRTLNEEKHLANLLDALKKQEYTNYEVIVVDSGSTDRTLDIVREQGARLIEIASRDFTFGYALNVGCKAASGRYLVFVSAHVIPVDTKWLGNLVAPFANERVAMVYGRQMGTRESKFSENMDFKRLFGTSVVNSAVPLNYANNANSAVRKDLWERHQFDEYLFGLEDIAWARTLAKEEYVIHYEPTAAIYHIHEERWSQVFNRYRREAIAAVRIRLTEPPQAKLGVIPFMWNVVKDLIASFPQFSRQRVEEIIRFRYYQWKGSNVGWKQGAGLDFKTMRESVFFPSENQAVVISASGEAEYTDVSLPEMRPGDVLLKVEYVGVCRTDLEVYEGTLGYYRDGHAKYPITPGHEFSATIMKIGSNNKFQERYRVGQRVVGECILSRGDVAKRKEVGVINHNGAYSRFVIAPGDSLHKIPDELDSKTAALTEPLAVVLRALRRVESRLKVGARVGIIGAGQIGNLCAQVLVHRGFAVTVFDKDENRLAMLPETVAGRSSELKELGQYDVVVEATGLKSVLEQVLMQLRVDGTLLLLGFPYGVMNFNFEDIVGKDAIVVGSVGADGVDFDAALALLPKLHMEEFTRVVMPLEDFESAWEMHKTCKNLKILLKP